MTMPTPDAPMFPIVRKGYERDHVDRYVTSLRDQIQQLTADLAVSQTADKPQAAGVAAYQPADIIDPNPMTGWSHESAVKVLEASQRVADQLVADAGAEKDRILSDARRQATQIVEAAESQALVVAQRYDEMVQGLAQSIGTLQEAVGSVRSTQLPLLRQLVSSLESLPIDELTVPQLTDILGGLPTTADTVGRSDTTALAAVDVPTVPPMASVPRPLGQLPPPPAWTPPAAPAAGEPEILADQMPNWLAPVFGSGEQ